MTEYRKHDSRASTEAIRSEILKDIDLDNNVKLNLGCGNDYISDPGWVNLDGDTSVKADVHENIEEGIMFFKGQFDVVYASHILEHISNLVFVKGRLATILKPGGVLIVVVPDYMSPDAWGDDTHKRAFSCESFILDFWPGFVKSEIKYMTVKKEMGERKWICAYLTKGE